MESYILSLIVIGIASLAMSWMPSIAKKTQISYSIIYVVLGIIIFSLFPQLPVPDPTRHQKTALHLTEIVVIISLMGTGLKIDQRFNLRTWRVPLKLVSITMIMCIAAVALICYYILNLDIASSLLLAAVLAPTDPVLASDVQVGPPLEKKSDSVRFSLTAEAGFNDGTAFPFTWLAVIVAGSAFSFSDLGLWVTRDILYRMMAGIAIGYGMGKLLAFFVFYVPGKVNFIVIRDGFVGIAATLLVYGIAELFKGYGFIAVFVAAITLRNYELHHKLHKKLHDFTEQIERIMVGIMLILFGGSLINGILNYLTWPMVIFSVAFVFLIRPLTGLVTLIGEKLHFKEKLAISFFGIRGMGSFFYLAFALEQTNFKYSKELWSVVSFIVILSILIHGLTATPVMNRLEYQFGKEKP